MIEFEVEDVRLNLTYGQVSGKWWGLKQKRPILLLHGWQDNVGTYDTLIPLLPIEFSYLAIDFPGHGFSAHYAKGCFYHTVDFIPFIEEVRIKLKWDRLSLIGHSMGAIISFSYAALFPEKVDLVIALDILKVHDFSPTAVQYKYTATIKQKTLLVANLKDESPEYMYDELMQRVHDGSKRSVNIDKAKYLIDRGTKPSPNNPNKFYFTRDIRVKYIQSFYVDHAVALNFIKQIQAAYLFIKSDDNNFSESKQKFQEAIDQFKKFNKNFEMLKVGGTHHVHLNQPELMAGKIGEFLKKHHIRQQQSHIDWNKIPCKL